MMLLPHKKHTYRPPWPVTGIFLHFYMQIMFVPQRKHTYGSPRLLGDKVLFCTCKWCSHFAENAPSSLHRLSLLQLCVYICKCCSYLTGHTYGPPQPVKGTFYFYLLYIKHKGLSKKRWGKYYEFKSIWCSSSVSEQVSHPVSGRVVSRRVAIGSRRVAYACCNMFSRLWTSPSHVRSPQITSALVYSGAISCPYNRSA
jgi:hypothetical protein